MTSSTPSALRDHIKNKDAQSLVDVFQQAFISKSEETSLAEALEILPREEAAALWALLAELVEREVLLLSAGAAESETETTQTQGRERERKAQALQAVAQAVSLFAQRSKHRCAALSLCVQQLCRTLDIHSPTATAATATDMHTDSSEQALKNAVSLLCEQWFLRGEDGAVSLLPQTLTFLLVESLKPSAKEATVKRLSSVRHGLEELDLASAGSEFTRELLLRCFVHPALLKSGEGVKFLSSLLVVCEGFLLESALGVIKAQAATGAQSVCSVYGEILQRTWKELSAASSSSAITSTGGEKKKPAGGKAAAAAAAAASEHSLSTETLRNALEDAVQDLVHEAVHCPQAKHFRGLRFVIKAFHDLKRSDALEEMLVKIFEPILWRSLRCANAIVRSQAAVLFLDVFPLQRVHARPEESDTLLQKQFDQLVSLLQDGDHRVRAIAVSGVLHILREYWDILPTGTVQNMLKFIFETLAFDVSSANVRYRVICGVQELLQQPLSHAMLKGLLPLIANLIHDKAERNRLAFIKLLNDVKTVRDIHFYEVVSVPHLLERFSLDRNHKEIGAAMCALLLDSFYPQNDDQCEADEEEDGGKKKGKKKKDSNDNNNNKKKKSKAAAGRELVRRCVQFVEESPLAAEAFYGSLHSQLGLGSITKLVVMIFHVLSSNLSKRGKASNTSGSGNKRRRGDRAASPEEEEEEKEEQFENMNDNVLAGLLRVVYALLDSVRTQLVGEIPCLQLLFQFFSLEKTMQFFEAAVAVFADRIEIVISAVGIVQILLSLSKDVSVPGADHDGLLEAFSAEFWCCDLAPHVVDRCENPSLRTGFMRSVISCVVEMEAEIDCLSLLTSSFKQHCRTTASSQKQKKNKLSNFVPLPIASLLLVSLTTHFCQPQLLAQMNDKVQVELTALMESVSHCIETTAYGEIESDLESILLCAKALSSWNSFQFCCHSLAGEEIVSSSSSPLARLVHWQQQIVENTFAASEGNFDALNGLVASGVLAICDVFYIVDAEHCEAGTSLLADLLQSLERSLSTHSDCLSRWTRASTTQHLMLGCDRVVSGLMAHLQDTVSPQTIHQLVESLRSIAAIAKDNLSEGDEETEELTNLVEKVLNEIAKVSSSENEAQA